MSTAKRKPLSPEPGQATYQDVLDAPPHMVAEILAGTLYTQPRPALPHARASSRLSGKLDQFDDDSGDLGGWWIVFEPELHFGEDIRVPDILVPDIAGWRVETMPTHPGGAYVTVAPDWVCEVLSPSTRHRDIGSKRDVYAREGVGHLWFVDPEARSLEVFELRGGQWLLLTTLFEDAEVCQPPFEAITFPLNALWLPRPAVHDKARAEAPQEEAAAVSG